MADPQSSQRPRRSVLYMPGANERALEKAKTLETDALILDLEDAVAPDAKSQARERVCAAATSGEYGDREITIRINGLGTLVVHSQGDVSWTHRASLTRRVGGLRDEVQEELLIAVLARQRARTTPHLAPACPDGCLGDLLHALLSPPLVEDDAT